MLHKWLGLMLANKKRIYPNNWLPNFFQIIENLDRITRAKKQYPLTIDTPLHQLSREFLITQFNNLSICLMQIPLG